MSQLTSDAKKGKKEREREGFRVQQKRKQVEITGTLVPARVDTACRCGLYKASKGKIS